VVTTSPAHQLHLSPVLVGSHPPPVVLFLVDPACTVKRGLGDLGGVHQVNGGDIRGSHSTSITACPNWYLIGCTRAYGGGIGIKARFHKVETICFNYIECGLIPSGLLKEGSQEDLRLVRHPI